MTVPEAYRRALASQIQPGMLVLAIGPVVAAGLFWAVVMWWKWATFLAAVDLVIRKLPYIETVVDRLVFYGFNIVPGMLTLWILAATFIPLTLVCALGFVSVAGMPLMLRHVAARHFGGLERRRGGSLAGSLVNSLGALLRFLLLAMVTFPLWFVPVFGWLVLPLLLGRLNASVLRYDALAEHASAEEIAALSADRSLSWQWLGFAGAMLNVVPFFWFFSTTLTGLAFIHYGLAALEGRRADLGEVPGVVA